MPHPSRQALRPGQRGPHLLLPALVLPVELVSHVAQAGSEGLLQAGPCALVEGVPVGLCCPLQGLLLRAGLLREAAAAATDATLQRPQAP